MIKLHLLEKLGEWLHPRRCFSPRQCRTPSTAAGTGQCLESVKIPAGVGCHIEVNLLLK